MSAIPFLLSTFLLTTVAEILSTQSRDSSISTEDKYRCCEVVVVVAVRPSLFLMFVVNLNHHASVLIKTSRSENCVHHMSSGSVCTRLTTSLTSGSSRSLLMSGRLGQTVVIA